MKTYNLWDPELGFSKFEYIYDIESFLKYIEEKKITDFSFKEKFSPNGKWENLTEAVFSDRNVEVIYTDMTHPVVILDSFFKELRVNPGFFELYKQEIIEALTKNILTNDTSVNITKLTYYPGLVDEIIEMNPYCSITFKDVMPTKEEIEKLKRCCIKSIIRNNSEYIEISDGIVFGKFSRKDLEVELLSLIKIEDLALINDETIKTLKDGLSLRLEPKKYSVESYNKLKLLLQRIEKLNKKLVIKIPVEDREIFNSSKILDNEYSNLNIVIMTDATEYSAKEYLEEEKQLDSLIRHIKDIDLSPLEKYIAVYNVVKNFKEYKENEENLYDSRQIRSILNNDYMVCVAYANLLVILCKRLGIDCEEFSIDVDTSYDKGYSTEETPVTKDGHARNLVKIDDPKYGVNGIFMADPTWDNNLKKDHLTHSLFTIDKTQLGRRMLWNKPELLILDVHSFEEFNDHINYLFKNEFIKEIKRDTFGDFFGPSYKYNKVIMETYSQIVKSIEKALQIDKENYEKIRNKYTFKTENDYIEFLTEIGHHIVSLTNQEFDPIVLIDANMEVRRKLGLEYVERDKMVEDYKRRFVITHPYSLIKEDDHMLEHMGDSTFLEKMDDPEMLNIIKSIIEETKVLEEEAKKEEGKSL